MSHAQGEPMQGRAAGPVSRRLEALFRLQHRALTHSLALARRLELGHGAFRLYEVVRHTEAALEDLQELALERGIVLDTTSVAVEGFLARTRSFLRDLLSETHASCRAALVEHCDVLRQTLRLGEATRAAGDDVLTAWCTECLERRLPMLERLAHAFATEQPGVDPDFFALDTADVAGEQTART